MSSPPCSESAVIFQTKCFSPSETTTWLSWLGLTVYDHFELDWINQPPTKQQLSPQLNKFGFRFALSAKTIRNEMKHVPHLWVPQEAHTSWWKSVVPMEEEVQHEIKEPVSVAKETACRPHKDSKPSLAIAPHYILRERESPWEAAGKSSLATKQGSLSSCRTFLPSSLSYII